jgi:hypothetical protein
VLQPRVLGIDSDDHATEREIDASGQECRCDSEWDEVPDLC